WSRRSLLHGVAVDLLLLERAARVPCRVLRAETAEPRAIVGHAALVEGDGVGGGVGENRLGAVVDLGEEGAGLDLAWRGSDLDRPARLLDGRRVHRIDDV